MSLLDKLTGFEEVSPVNNNIGIISPINETENRNKFKLAVEKSRAINPENASQTIKLKEKTGLPEDHIERNLSDVKNNAILSDIDYDKLSKENPVVSEWMSESPNNAAAGYQDLTNMSYVERQLRNIKGNFDQDIKKVELSDIGTKALLGTATQQDRQKQAEIEKGFQEASNYGITGYFEGIPGAVAGMLPTMANTIKGKVKAASVGLVGGIGTGVAASAILPPQLKPISVAGFGGTGLAIGWRAGAAIESAKMEAGLAYLDYERIQTIDGKLIDPKVARRAAIITGAINGSLEAIGFEAVTKFIPGMNGLPKKAAKETVKKAVLEYFKNVGEASLTEFTTEGLQEITKIVGQEIITSINNKEEISLDTIIERTFSPENREAILSSAIQGSQGGGGIAVVTGGVSTAVDIKKIKRASEKAEEIKKAGEVIEAMNLTKTNPESVEGIVNKVTEDGDMYIPPDSFNTYWQQQGEDPREVAKKILGDDISKYDEAVESGHDIVVPSGKYYTSEELGGGQHKDFFANEVRTDPMDMNAREANEEFVRLDDNEQKAAEEEASAATISKEKEQAKIANAKIIKQYFKDKLIDSGFDQKQSESYAKLHESIMTTLASRSGIEPIEFFERFKPEINKLDAKETKTFLSKIQSGIKKVFSGNEISSSVKEISLEDGKFVEKETVIKGAFRFGNGKFNIDLLSEADLSTFLHETGHFYLEVLAELSVTAEEGSQIKNDYQKLLEWFGVNSREEIKREHHEQFARGMELYLMKGEAPSQELRRIFARFKVWLFEIYKSLREFSDIDLTDEVKGVFDRIIATDEMIQGVDELAIEPMITNYELLGDKANDYKKAIEDYRNYVSEKTTQKLVEDYQKEQSKQYKNELKKIKKEVEAELYQINIYRLYYYLTGKKRPDGTRFQKDGEVPIKLDKNIVTKMIGSDRVSKLPKGIFETSKEGGIYPSALAELFSFRSGNELISALESFEDPKDFVERVSKERVLEKFPNIDADMELFKSSIMDDVQHEKRSQILRFELKWLAEQAPKLLKEGIRLIPKKIIPSKEVKAYAEKTIGKVKINKIQPHLYRMAERKFSNQSAIALSNGDFNAAFEFKKRQIINNELYREAVKAKAYISKTAVFTKAFKKDKVLAKTRDINIVNVIRTLLAGHGIGNKDKDIESYLNDLKKYDEDTYNAMIGIINSVDTIGKNLRQLTYDQFQTLKETIEALWSLSKRLKQIEIDGTKMNLEDIVQELSDRLQEVSKKELAKSKYRKSMSDWDKTKQGLLGIRASLIRAENWATAIDGKNPDGVFKKYIVRPVFEAVTKYRTKETYYFEKFSDLVNDIKEDISFTPIAAPELGNGSFEFKKGKVQLLGAMLHIGNPSNKQKLLRGNGWGEFTEDGVLDTRAWDRFINRMIEEKILTKKDYDFLQSVWDIFEEMKPEAQKAHKDMYGYYFNEITAEEVVTPFGKYKGGYIAALIDPYASIAQETRNEKEILETNNSSVFPTTGRGRTLSRIESVAEPLIMDLRLVTTNIDQILRFTHIEPKIKDVAKIITHKAFRETLNEFDPRIVKEMLIPWLQRTATQMTYIPSSTSGGRLMDKFFNTLRNRASLNIMTGNVLNVMQQITGFFPAMTQVDKKYLLMAMGKFIKDPSKTSQMISDRSEFMNNKTENLIINMNKGIDDIIINKNKYDNAKDYFNTNGYILQVGAQNIVDIIVWTGKYNESIAKGLPENTAVREADSAVRLSQGSTNPESLSKYEANTALIRFINMFTGYFNTLSNLLGTEFVIIARELGFKNGAGKLFLTFFLTVMMTGFISELIIAIGSGDYDKDDDEEYLDDTLAYFFGGTFRTLTAMVPIAGPLINAGVNRWNDKTYDDRISTSPVISLLEKSVSSPYSVYQAIVNDGDKRRAATDVLTAIGMVSGIPTAPLAKPVGYLIDVNEGDAEPTGPIDFTRGLVTGRPGD